MRRRLVAVAIVMVVTGAVLVTIGSSANSFSTTFPNPPNDYPALKYAPLPLFGGGTTTIAWSGATFSFRIFVYQCGDWNCSLGAQAAPPGPVVAGGGGANGSVSFSVSTGSRYAVFTWGHTETVPATVTEHGLTVFTVVGVALAVTGAVAAAAAVRLKSPAVPITPPLAPERGERGGHDSLPRAPEPKTRGNARS